MNKYPPIPDGGQSGGWRLRLVERFLPAQNKVVNPLVVSLGERGWVPPTYAPIEPTGRRSGLPDECPWPTASTVTPPG